MGKAAEKKIIRSLDQIPRFRNELEESDWWDEHELAPELMESGPQVEADFYKALGVANPKKRLNSKSKISHKS